MAFRRFSKAAVLTGLAATLLYGHRLRIRSDALEADCLPKHQAGVENKKLPYYTAEQIREHSSLKGEKGVWVTYKAGVYDITPFVSVHPGGEKRIMLAAGSDIDRWWSTFTIHDDDAVRDILEQHRVGNLRGYVPRDPREDEKMWAKEPVRSPGLQILSQRPFNAQSPEGIMDEFITPNDLFFVRNHMPVPDLRNRPDFCAQVEGDGVVPHCYTVDELRRGFPEHTITATIECGGNRRREMANRYSAGDKGVKGLAWDGGAIGNATWTGVYLRDVIAACQKVPLENPDTYHVQFEGADSDAAGHFQVSIPYNLATSADADVLLAYKMNGQDLPPDHGYPLRAIVPGTVGVRNCKWLQRITVQPFEAQTVWQQNDYKNFPSWETKPKPEYPSVYSMPVQSSLTDAKYDPAEDAIALRAYAFCGGGRGIQRVEVSYDGGATFEKTATILPAPPNNAAVLQEASPPSPAKRKAWAWRQVASSVPLDDIQAKPEELGDGSKRYRTCIRAVTEDNEVQPPVSSYNFRGLLYNGYSCRDVIVE